MALSDRAASSRALSLELGSFTKPIRVRYRDQPVVGIASMDKLPDLDAFDYGQIVGARRMVPSISEIVRQLGFSSNESRFHLCPGDHRRRVWRQPRQRADPVFTNTHHTGPQPYVIVWGAISFYGWTPLVVIRGTYSTAVRGRHSENSFATVPFAAAWPYFSAR
ncbi:transposable element Tc1 transposase [Trichonephila clavipes]|nr:transposable element Tc1 transposase [Trichonephila clavipes]